MLIIGALTLFAGGGGMASIAMGLGICFGALVAFGMAQVITAICETAFNTRHASK